VLGGANNYDSGGVFNSNIWLYGTNSSASKLIMTGFGGGVGIGTTAPTSGTTLDVNGVLNCTNLWVSWAYPTRLMPYYLYVPSQNGAYSSSAANLMYFDGFNLWIGSKKVALA
jgi:hypothetical protein